MKKTTEYKRKPKARSRRQDGKSLKIRDCSWNKKKTDRNKNILY